MKKVLKRAEAQGFGVEKRKTYWDRLAAGRRQPCGASGTPNSQRTWPNLLACLKRKGYNP